jgi:DNA-directed RNA polymerase subunit L
MNIYTMVKVSQISIVEHSFEQQFKKPDDDTKKCIAMLSAKDLLSLLPKTSNYTVRFKLSDANSQLANAIRRCIVDEIPTYAMTFNILHNSDGSPADFVNDISTKDKSIFGKCDELKKRIEAIPIRQDIVPADWKITLKYDNTNGNDLSNIMSSDFKILYKGKPVSVDSLMYDGYILTRIEDGYSLTISNIRIVQGIGRTNANSFKYVTRPYYEILAEPMDKVNGKFVGKSSLESDYKEFIMGYTTYRNHVKPFEPIKAACNTLIERLQVILNEWEQMPHDAKQEKTIGELSGKIIVNKEAKCYIIKIANEGYTIANLLSYYIYKELPTIEFSSGGIEHLDRNIGVVVIKNEEYVKIFTNATKKAIADLQIVESSFKD